MKDETRFGCYSRRMIPALLSVLIGVSCTPPPPAVTILQVPNGGVTPDAEVGADGALHVAYVTGSDVYYAVSTDGGRSFGAPVRVNSEPNSAQAGAFRGPDLAIGPNGRAHVVWYTNAYQRRLPTEEWGVHYAYMDPGSAGFTPARNLNHIPSDNYSLAVDHTGNHVAVVWTADSAYLQWSTDGGQTFSAPERIEQANPCDCCATRAYFSVNGDLYIAYRDKTNNQRDMNLLVRGREGAGFTRRPLSQTTWTIEGCPMTGAFLTGDGVSLLAAWETKGVVYYGVTDTGGRLQTPGEIRVADEGRYPVALPLSGGGAVIAWKEETTLAWQMFDAAGRPTAPIQRRPGSSPHRPGGAKWPDGAIALLP